MSIKHKSIVSKLKITVAATALLSLTACGGSLEDDVSKPFPDNSSIKDQCQFVSDFLGSYGEVLQSDVSAEEIRNMVKDDLKNTHQYENTPKGLYYDIKKELFEDAHRAKEQANRNGGKEFKMQMKEVQKNILVECIKENS